MTIFEVIAPHKSIDDFIRSHPEYTGETALKRDYAVMRVSLEIFLKVKGREPTGSELIDFMDHYSIRPDKVRKR